MTEWFSTVPALFVGTALVFLPGAPLAWALRLRGFAFISGAIAASFAAFAIASVVAPLIGLSWGPLPGLAAAAAFFALGLVVRFFMKPNGRSSPHEASVTNSRVHRVAVLVGLGIAFTAIFYVLVRSIGSPSAVSQNYDTPFHLNATAFILHTGSASPFDMSLASAGGSAGFYPTLWHAFVSLIALLTGVTVPIATTVATLIVSAVIWPVGMMFVSTFFTTKYRFAPVVIGAAIPLFASFPYRFLSWGLLYPNLLSTALLALCLGFVVRALTPSSTEHQAPRLSLWLASVGALGAASFAHPNALFSLIVIAVPAGIAHVVRVLRSPSSTIVRASALTGLLVVLMTSALLWSLVSTGDNTRSYEVSFTRAFLEGALTSPLTDTRGWFVALLVIAGSAVLFWRRQHRWLPVAYVVVVSFFAISMGPDSSFRDFFTEAWYNDAHRLASLIAIVGIPLAAVGAEAAILYIAGNKPPREQFFVTGGIALVMLTVFQGQIAAEVRANIHANFVVDETSTFVTADELELFERLEETTPEDAVIASNPWNGSVYIYAISDRELLFPHLKGDFGVAAESLASDFGQDGDRTCALLTELGVTHLVGSEHPTYMKRGAEFEGLNDLASSPLLTAVDSVGEATLYTITGCK